MVRRKNADRGLTGSPIEKDLQLRAKEFRLENSLGTAGRIDILVGRLQDNVEIVALVGIQLRSNYRLRHTDDAAQCIADFTVHVCQGVTNVPASSQWSSRFAAI